MVTSGSAPGGGEQKPQAGYYPDPSIPGYVRYWNGSGWVPGSSRPEPVPGEVLAPPPGADQATPGGVAPGAMPGPAAPRVPQPGPARTPAVDESGPMFLDEDPDAPVAQTPADQARPAGGRSGTPGGAPEAAKPAGGPGFPATPGAAGGYPNPQGPAAGRPAGGYGYPAAGSGGSGGGYGYPAAGSGGSGGGYGYPNPAAGSGGYGYPQAGSAATGESGSWQRQVQELARQDAMPGVPGQAKGPGEEAPPLPWRPPVSNPFLDTEQARPAAPVRRLIARMLDSVLVGAVVGAVAAPLALASVHHIQQKIDAARQTGETVQVWLIDGTTGLYLGIIVAALLLAGLLYEVLPTARWGRTLGKKLLGLQVLDIESQLTPGFGQALRRMLVHYGLQLLAIGILDSLWCVFDQPWRQSWHDKAARTFVAGGD